MTEAGEAKWRQLTGDCVAVFSATLRILQHNSSHHVGDVFAGVDTTLQA